jgi:hypothetical protein
MMRRLVLALPLIVLSTSLFAAAHKAVTRPSDANYSSALAAANRFLHAWQNQDHETGIIMLTDSARQHASPELLQTFFSPGPQAAYEIARGRKVGAAGYVFPVALFGLSQQPSRPHYSKIFVSRAGKDDWVVDKLP